MTKEKDSRKRRGSPEAAKKISDIFFGKAESVFENIRLFLRFKKIAKISAGEEKAIEGAREKLEKLYGGKIGSAEGAKKTESSPKKNPALSEDKNVGSEEKDLVFISLSEIAKNSTYSKNYINYSARQGKLRAKKINGVWHTTEQWLADFTQKSQAKKNEFKEKLSHDLGGNKKFVAEAKKVVEEETPENSEKKEARKIREEIVSFQMRLKKIISKNWTDAKTWIRDLGELEGAREIAKLRKAKLSDFLKPASPAGGFDFARPALAMIVLVALMAVGSITKADLAHWQSMGKKKAYFAYNAAVDGISKVAGKNVSSLKVGADKFVKIAQDILRQEKIKEFEKKSNLSLRGSENAKGEVAGVESESSTSGTISRAELSEGGRVLAAATGAAQMNVGDIEVSAYLLNEENKEIPNGEYDARFGIYTSDRTEADPFPSDTDKGSRVWEETQKVIVENGLLKTYLGKTTPIPTSFNFAASNYFIGIRVGEDAEMVPRKRIGAVPLARTAMNIAGQAIGNGAGNIPLSNGTLSTNLNADLLDGKHASAFMLAGTSLTGDYDNYVAWKLQSGSMDAGQKIKSNKGAIFTGANGLVTSRLLNTLTVSPVYGSTENTIAQGSTVITVGTEGNLEGGGSGTAGGGLNLTLSITDNPTFNTVYLTTLDLGANTITDGNFSGNWNFGAGNVQGISSLTATTGNFTTANITTGNITTIDFGTNTVTDGNMNGDWNFNAGNLSGIATATVTGNFYLTAPTNLIFGGTTSLGEATGPLDSGAYLVGVSTAGFSSSASSNVQDVLADLDSAIGGGGGGLWTLAGGTVYPTGAANDFAIGGTSPTASMFGIDESLGNFYFGYDNSASPTFNFEATDGDAGEFGFDTNDAFFFSNANVGIGTTNPGTTLDVIGDGRFSSTLTASNGFTLTTGALNLTATSGALALSGLSASSIDAGANNLTFTSGNFNTTATGINSTAIGATTASTGAFTTLSSSGTTNLGTSGASNVNIAVTGTGNTTIGNATGTFQLTSNGGLNVTAAGALTGVASIDTISFSSTALTFAGAGSISAGAGTALALDAGTTGEVNIAGTSTGNVNLAGGSGATGCTVDNATGNFTCSGNITGSSSGTVGFWTRTGTNLSPATAGDDLYLGANQILGVGYDPTTLLAGTSAAFSGNVGIGTTAPGSLLEVNGTVQLRGAAGSTGLKVGANGYVGIGTAVSGYMLDVSAAAASYLRGPTYIGSVITATISTGADNTAMTVMSRNFTNAGTMLNMATGTFSNIDAGASSAVAIKPIYNQASGAESNTDLLINRTETAIGSGSQYLISAGTGGGTYISKFSVTNTGQGYFAGSVGIGTTNPGSYKLNVSGSLIATDYYSGDGTQGADTTTGGLTFKDGLYTSGTIASGLPANGTITGETLYWNGSAWTPDTNLFNNATNVGIGTTLPTQLFQVNNSGSNPIVMTSGGYLGIGTTSPTHFLETRTSASDYIGYFYNTSTNAAAGGLYIRSDGTGSLLTLNYNGSNILDITPSQTTFSNPVNFASSGDVSIAYDLYMTHATAGSIKFTGPGYIQTESASENLNLYLSAANAGYVVLNDSAQSQTIIPMTDDTYDLGDDTHRFANLWLGPATLHLGTSVSDESWMSYDTTNNRFNLGVGTTGSAPILTVTSGGNVGIGTTNPGAALTVGNNLFQVNSSGNIVKINNVTTSFPGSQGALGSVLTNSDGAGTLTWAAPSGTGAIGYWTRSGTNLSPTTAGDDLYLSGTSYLGVGYDPTTLLAGTSAAFSGNVGIGTTSPGAALEIKGAAGNNILQIKNSNNLTAFVMDNNQLQAAFYGLASNFATYPGITFVGDTNTGMFRNGEDTMGFTTGAAERLRITSAGYIGIGTSAPSQLFQVNNSGSNPIVMTSGGYLGIGTTTPDSYLTVDTGMIADPSHAITINGDADSTKIVGLRIFNSAPLAYQKTGIEFGGYIDTVFNRIISQLDVSGSFSNLLFNYGSGATSTALTIAGNTGNVGIGTTNPGNKLTISGGVGIGTTSPSSLYLTTAAPDGGMIIEGRVGIGTTSPGSRLDIVGSGINSDMQRWISSNGNIIAKMFEAGNPNDVMLQLGNGTPIISLRTDGGSYINSNLAIGNNNPGTAKLAVMNGNVGIGDTSPAALLTVGNGDLFQVDSSGAIAAATGITSSGTITLSGLSNDASEATGILINGSNQLVYREFGSNAFTSTAYVDYSGTSAGYIPKMSDADTLTNSLIYDAGGAIGIGTTDPEAEFHLMGTGMFSTTDFNSTALTGSAMVMQTLASTGDVSSEIQAYIQGGNGYGSLLLQAAGGLVGIGSTTPASLLSVGSGNQFQVNSSGNIVKINNVTTSFPGSQGALGSVLTNSDGAGTLTWAAPSGSGAIGYWTRTGTNLSPTTAGDDLYLGANQILGVGYDPTTLLAGTSAAFSGNVGIGTTSPGYPLRITKTTAGSITYPINIQNNDTINNGAGVGIDFTVYSDVVTGRIENVRDSTGTYSLRFSNYYGGVLNEKMRIAGNGNVGIGTTNPGNKLTVSGGVGIGTTSPSSVYLTTAAPDGGMIIEGRVGIGTTSPGYALQVNSGNIAVNYGYGYKFDALGTDRGGLVYNNGVDPYNGIQLKSTNSARGIYLSYGTSQNFGLFRDNGDFNTTPVLFANSSSNVGIGTTAPGSYKLNVSGSLIATDYYSGDGTQGADTTTGGLTFKDGLYTSGALATGLPTNGTITGETLYWNGSAWTANVNLFNNNTNVGIGTTNPSQLFQVNSNGSNPIVMTSGGYLGIGTTSPTHFLETRTSASDYIGYFYNTSTNVAAGGLYIRSDGTGSLLTLNYNGTNILDITPSQTTFSNPVNFASSGDVSIAYDLYMTHATAGNIKFTGPGYIQTESASENLDLTLSAANSGYVVIADTLQVAGDILPDADDTYNLGSDTARFANLWLGPDTLHIGTSSADESWMSYDTTNNRFNLGVGTTGSAPALTVNSSGYLGIGTTNPSTTLHISTGNAEIARFTRTGGEPQLGIFSGSTARILLQSNMALGFGTNETLGAWGTPEMYIDGSGNVGIGYGSNLGTAKLAVNGNVGIGTTAPAQKLEITDGNIRGFVNSDTLTNFSALKLTHYSDTLTYTNNGATLGELQFVGEEGSADRTLAKISSVVEGVTGSVGSGLRFFTTADSGGSLSEKMRISMGGLVGIGTTSPGNKLTVSGGVGIGTTSPSSVYLTTAAPDGGMIIEGKVGIGTTNPMYDLVLSKGRAYAQIISTTADEEANLRITNDTNSLYIGVADDNGSGGGPFYGSNFLDNAGVISTSEAYELQFGIGNSAKMTIDTSGYVGIGTTNPDYLLDIDNGAAETSLTLRNGIQGNNYGLMFKSGGTVFNGGSLYANSGYDFQFRLQNDGADYGLSVDGSVGIGTTSPGNKLTISGGVGIGTTSPSSLYLTTAAPDGGMIIEGRVGIGTTAPSGLLEISSAGPYMTFTESDAAADNRKWDIWASQDKLRIRAVNDAYSAAGNIMEVDRTGTTIDSVSFPNGNVGIGTTNPGRLLELSAASAIMRMKNDIGYWDYFSHSDGSLQIYNGSVYALYSRPSNSTGLFMKSTGQVGIGTTAPTNLLDVAGGVKIGAGYAGISTTAPLNGLVVQGNLGVGTTLPGRKMDILDDASPQLRLSQAVGIYGEFQIDASGNLTYASTGTTAAFTSKTVSAATFSGSGASLTGIPETAIDDGTVLARVAGAETIAGAWIFTNEPSLSGAGRHSRTAVLSPEYSGAVLSAFYGAGTDASITGSMTSDAEPSADNLRTYYEWNSSEASLNYYTVAVRVTLPSDFDAWQTTNAVQVDLDTETNSAADNSVDVYIYNGDDTPGTAVTSSTANKSSVADTWTTVSIDDSVIDDGAAPDWDAGGEKAVIYLRVGSKGDNFARIGDIKLNYLSKW